MSDIVERLQAYGNPKEWAEWSLIPKLLADAVNEIESLRAERDALQARIDRAKVLVATRNGVIRTDTDAFVSGKRVALVPLD